MRHAALLVAFVLSACAPQTAISDISADKVVVRGAFADQYDAMGQADHGCSQYGKAASFLSQRCLTDACAVREFLFACRVPSPSRPQTRADAATDTNRR